MTTTTLKSVSTSAQTTRTTATTAKEKSTTTTKSTTMSSESQVSQESSTKSPSWSVELPQSNTETPQQVRADNLSLPALRHHLSFQVLEWVNNFLMTWLNKTQTPKPGPGLTSSTSFGVQQNPLFKPPRVPGYNPESDARGPGLRPTTNPGLNIPRVPRFPRRQLRPRSGGFYNYRTYRGFQL